MLRIIALLLALNLCLEHNVQAQEQQTPERYLEVRGTSELDMEPLARATVNLYEGTNKIKSIQTGADGSFSMRLEINKQYTIEVEKEGLVSKRISFNTQMPDEETGTWMNEFSIGLLRSCSGMDYSVLKQPVDQVKFDAKKRQYISDKDYTSSMRSRIEALMMKNDQCLLNTYESIIKKADQSATQKNYQEAINSFKEAQKLFPNEEYPAKRVAEMNALMGRQQNASDMYQKLITEADGLSSVGKTNEALQKYRQASVLNPQQTYPKQKISEIESAMAQQQSVQQAQQNLDDRFNQAMAKASVAYTKKDYAVAKQYYQEALQLKPGQSLATSRVQEIETIQAKKASEDAAKATEAAKKEAFEKEYQGLVAQADELFKNKKFEEAKAAYAKALTMKPSESYPAQRVKTIENAVATEQINQQKIKEDGYNAAMAAANTAIARNQYEIARESLQKALTIKPDDLAAKSRLAQLDELSKEFAIKKSREEQYANLIQSADALLAKKEYIPAKDSYLQALALKPGDKYAQTRITSIENTVAADQAVLQKKQNDDFNQAIAAGNTALAQNKFPQAKEFYQKALSIKPDDLSAKSKIIETDRLAREYAQSKAADEQYQKIIVSGDGFLAARDLVKAREAYTQALSVKPNDQYAQSRITSIDNTMVAEQAAKLKATEEGYKAAIGSANTAIAQKSYTQAKEFLQKALSLKPGDAYATGKVADVEHLIAEQQKKMDQEQQLTRQYNESIALADKYMADKDYTNARNTYNKALQLKPGDSYAGQKLSAIDNLMALEQANKQQQIEETFKNAMDKGSKALASKNYSAALEAFKQALAIKPADNNARQKISDTELLIKQEQDKLLADQARKKKYDELVRGADQFFSQKDYSNAKTSYELALAAMPGEVYPRQKLDETNKAIEEQDKKLAEEKARDNAYLLAINSGDKFLKIKDYDQAKVEYTRALGLKPNEALPKTKLTEIENLITRQQKEQTEIKARTDAYTAAINSGNTAFAKKDYPVARTAYAEALKVMPNDPLATDQIKKIDYLLSEAERIKKAALDKKAAYDACIATADKLFDEGKYPVAKDNYKKALTIDATSAYAKQRIERIDEINRSLAQSSVKTNNPVNSTTPKVVAAMPMGDMNFKTESEKQRYLDELMKKYPAGITLEKYKEQYRDIFRYIIIREGQAQEFRYIKYNTYSGAQYSVNGKPITQQYFLSQTKVREGESFKEIDMQ
jgi:tetratricopeptide (TPR) repeat protein